MTNKTTPEERLLHSSDYAREAINDEAQAVLGLLPQIDENFEKAVNMMYHCHGKVIVTGVGKSGNIGMKIAATLASTGTPSFFINPLDAYHGDLGAMSSEDVVLALSNSGQTDELLRFIPILIHMHVPIIAMTRNPESLLAKYSNVHVTVSRIKDFLLTRLTNSRCMMIRVLFMIGSGFCCSWWFLRLWRRRRRS